jgi:hypothetical protein
LRSRVVAAVKKALLDSFSWIAWHTSKLTLLVLLVIGLGSRSIDLLHCTYVLVYLLLASIESRLVWRGWPLLTSWAVVILGVQAATLVLAPPSAIRDALVGDGGGLGELSNALDGGGNALPGESAHSVLLACFHALGPPVLFFLLLQCQALVFRSTAFRRAAARRRWRKVRRVHLPTCTALKRARSPYPVLIRWGSYVAILFLALVPTARLAGLLYVGAFVCFVYLEQGVQRQTTTWRLLLWYIIVIALLAELIVRLALVRAALQTDPPASRPRMPRLAPCKGQRSAWPPELTAAGAHRRVCARRHAGGAMGLPLPPRAWIGGARSELPNGEPLQSAQHDVRQLAP